MDNKYINLSTTSPPLLSDNNRRFLCSSPILTESLLKLQQNNEEEEKEELKDSFKTNIKSSKICPNLNLTKINRESFKKKKQQQKQLSRFDLILLRAFQQNNDENTSLLPPLPLFTASYSLCSSDGASRHNSLEMLGTFGDFNEKFNYYEEEEGEGEEGEEGEESLFCSNNSSATTSARGSACSALLHPDEGASVFKRIEIENEEEGGNEWNEQIEEETSEKYNNKLTFLFLCISDYKLSVFRSIFLGFFYLIETTHFCYFQI